MKDDNPLAHFGHISIDTTASEASPDYASLPLMATRDFVLFPGVTFPISLVRESTLRMATDACERNVLVGIVCQTNSEIENPRVSDLQRYGVIGQIFRIIDLPDGTKTAIVSARNKFRITGPAQYPCALGDGMLCSAAEPVKESHVRPTDKELLVLVQAIKESMMNIFNNAAGIPDDLKFNIENTDQAAVLVNLISTHAPFSAEFKGRLLALNKLKERAYMLLTELSKNEQLSEINRDIQRRTKARIDENQRNIFLREQLQSIREELYGDVDDTDKFRKRLEEVAVPAHAAEAINREIDKLDRLQPQSPEYSVQYGYIDTLLSLPWTVAEPPQTDFAAAQATLDADHYGLEKVKERILEQIAVVLNNPEGRSPIICLVGAPGVGKTSLGESIARAMGRKYQRVSLGGMHDEAEVRGHRRTYIGALPGRIMEGIRRCGSSNPVMLLDEIDKMGQDFRGDPSAALLEVLDPEQNCHFHDNYIDIDYDLSKVMFIATANTLQTVPQPLLDRMEVIEISGYLMEEKMEIAHRHLLPRLLHDNGLQAGDIGVTDDALRRIIERYTAESGVRALEKQLAKIVRQGILRFVRDGASKPLTIGEEMVHELLGIETYTREKYEGNDLPGVVTGLAWTQVGGEILYIESSLSPAKQFGLELTGNLGNVMKESATIAAQWVKAHADMLGIPREKIDGNLLNIHAPEGAIPKDGPSAGITIVTSIVSTYKQLKVRERLAMTGEITLRGRVLPVGGIKEKILAAKRAGITDIILPGRNRKDVDDIPSRYLDGLTFHYVDTVAQVIDLAITSEQASTI